MVDRVFTKIYVYRRRLWIVLVLLPMLVLSVYYLFIATDRYSSESKVVLQRTGDLGAQIAGISLPFLGSLGGGGKEEALQLIEFIHSFDLFERLEERFQMREEFTLRGLDLGNHLMPWATKQSVLALYRQRVGLDFDERSGVLTLRTQFNTPERTKEINEAVLAEAEKFINELSHKAARDQLAFATHELMAAKKSFDSAKEELLSFQNEKGVIDPAASVEAGTRIIHELEAQVAGKEAELKALSAMLQENAPQVVSLRQAIQGIKSQVDSERARLASAKGRPLNRSAAHFLELKTLVDFHADVYKIALAATEKTRIESARKIKTLAILASPQLADAAEYPRRAPQVLAGWLISLLVLFGLIRLAIEIIEDHRD